MSICTFKSISLLCFLAVSASTFAQEKKVSDPSQTVETDPGKLFEPGQLCCRGWKGSQLSLAQADRFQANWKLSVGYLPARRVGTR